jgi:acetoin utilization deacetylase AcuC-like enzyme
MLQIWSSASYAVPLPQGHRFPMEKYVKLRERVAREQLVMENALHEPPRATRDALLAVHSEDYVDRVTEGRLDERDLRRLGFPWSEALVERSYRSVGGTCAAVEAALDCGVAMNLAGGTHHAFPDHGEGFCVFNDVAIAVATQLARSRIQRAAIIDLDVHQGNGTHAIFASDARVFTFSMHGRRNYPFHRVAGSLDVELDDATGDDAYLERLQDALPRVLAEGRPDLVVYLAGADPHEGDRLGRLKLTFGGLARRDAIVLESCRDVGIPVAITIAGGYGRDIDATVEVHMRTARVARDFA